MGVPALARCVLGPSARIDWATWSFLSSRIVGGPEHEREDQRGHRRHRRAEGDVAEDVEAGEPAGERIEQPVQHVRLASVASVQRERLDRPVEADAPRSLEQDDVARGEKAREQRRRVLGRRRARTRRLRATRPRPPPSPIQRARSPTQTRRSARPATSRPAARCQPLLFAARAPACRRGPRSAGRPASAASVSSAARIEAGFAL